MSSIKPPVAPAISSTLAWCALRRAGHDAPDISLLAEMLQTCSSADLTVVARALHGDESSWKTIIDLAEQVRKKQNRRGKLFDDQDVDDLHSHLVSEAPSLSNPPNLKMRLATYSGKASLYAWLCAIVVRRAISRKRKESRMAGLDRPDDLAFDDREQDADEVRELVLKAIESLGSQHQLVARLHFIEELKGVEIAARLHLTPTRISQIIRQIKEQLREKLADQIE